MIWLRELPSELYLERPIPGAFIEFAEAELLPQIRITGYKQDEKRKTALHCLHNLVCAGLMGKTVADSRDKTKTPPLRIRVWDAIVNANMAVKATGSEASQCSTRYYRTPWVLRLKRLWELAMLSDEERNKVVGEDKGRLTGNVVLTTGKRQVSIYRRVRATRMAYEDMDWQNDPMGKTVLPGVMDAKLQYYRELEDKIEGVNRNNMRHTWEAEAYEKSGVDGKLKLAAFQPSVCVRLKYSGELHRCGRLYTKGPVGGQSLPKEVRRTIKIDGQKTVELDYGQFHIRMLYHFARIDPQHADLYQPEAVFKTFKSASPERKKAMRDLLKQATNILFNVDAKHKAVGAIRELFAEAEPRIRNLLYKTEKAGAAELLKRIEDAHPKIKDRFFTNVGTELLMSTDGYIMLWILDRFLEANKPALPVHDSLVVKQEDADFAEKTMADCYYAHLQFEPQINKK